MTFEEARALLMDATASKPGHDEEQMEEALGTVLLGDGAVAELRLLRAIHDRAVDVAQPSSTGGTRNLIVRKTVMWILYGGERP